MQILTFLWKRSRALAIASAVIGLISGISSAAILAWLNMGLSQAQHPNIRTALQYAALVVIVAASSFGAQAISLWLSESSAQKLRVQLARAISLSPLRQLEEVGSSRLFVLMTQEAGFICDAFIKVPEFLINAVALLASLIYLGSLSPTLLTVLIVLLIGCVLNFIVLQRMAMRYIRVSRGKWDELAGHFQALIGGSKELKLNDRRREVFLSEMVEGASVQYRDLAFQSGLRYVALSSINSIFYFAVSGVIVFCLPFWRRFTIEELSSYALVILFLRGPVSSLVQIFPSFDRARIALERTQSLKITLGESETALLSPAGNLPPVVRESITLHDVKHSYYREDDERHFTLGPVTFALTPGKIVFIVGGNGSGKTTFAKLLTGLYLPEGGRVTVDGQAVDDGNRDRYRQYFSVVFQDFYLFEQLLGTDKTSNEGLVDRCLNELQLRHKVSIRDGRLSTTSLSQGQRKRLALLAALVEDRQLCVFDEWAADQDPRFKQVFYLEILPELKAQGKTIVVISHDDRFYCMADEIVRLEEGQLTVMDAHGAATEVPVWPAPVTVPPSR